MNNEIIRLINQNNKTEIENNIVQIKNLRTKEQVGLMLDSYDQMAKLILKN